MPVFRVMLSGNKIVLRTDRGEATHGFVRNEYVYALTSEVAIEKAKLKAMRRIAENEAIVALADTPLELTVDEVEANVPFWKLTVNESFIFFPHEGETKA